MPIKFKTKRRSPYAAKTAAHVLQLKTDNIAVGDFSIYADNKDVSFIHAGHQIDIPVQTFNKLLGWYKKPQPIQKQP